MFRRLNEFIIENSGKSGKKVFIARLANEKK
jgi:hypothetical protein